MKVFDIADKHYENDFIADFELYDSEGNVIKSNIMVIFQKWYNHRDYKYEVIILDAPKEDRDQVEERIRYELRSPCEFEWL